MIRNQPTLAQCFSSTRNAFVFSIFNLCGVPIIHHKRKGTFAYGEFSIMTTTLGEVTPQTVLGNCIVPAYLNKRNTYSRTLINCARKLVGNWIPTRYISGIRQDISGLLNCEWSITRNHFLCSSFYTEEGTISASFLATAPLFERKMPDFLWSEANLFPATTLTLHPPILHVMFLFCMVSRKAEKAREHGEMRESVPFFSASASKNSASWRATLFCVLCPGLLT